jgi:hypothetical protein
MNLRAEDFKKEKRAISPYKPRVRAIEQASGILICLGGTFSSERGFSGTSEYR